MIKASIWLKQTKALISQQNGKVKSRSINGKCWLGLLRQNRWRGGPSTQHRPVRYANLKHYGGSNHLVVPTGLLQELRQWRFSPAFGIVGMWPRVKVIAWLWTEARNRHFLLSGFVQIQGVIHFCGSFPAFFWVEDSTIPLVDPESTPLFFRLTHVSSLPSHFGDENPMLFQDTSFVTQDHHNSKIASSILSSLTVINQQKLTSSPRYPQGIYPPGLVPRPSRPLGPRLRWCLVAPRRCGWRWWRCGADGAQRMDRGGAAAGRGAAAEQRP